MPIQTKKWYEKLFELLIFFGLVGVAYGILKNSELGSVTFYVFLAFGFAYLYNKGENSKHDLSSLNENVEINFNQAFDSLQRKQEAIESLESAIIELKLANSNLENQLAELKYDIQTK